MDETQISITVRPIYLERLLYWIIIIVLAVLLVLAWMKQDCTSTDAAKTTTTTKTTAQEPTTPAAQPTPAPAAAPAPQPTTPSPAPTDLKASGQACTTSSECAGGYCVNKVCSSQPPPTLSGKIDFTVSDVQYKVSPSNTTKLVGLSYKITNGLTDDMSGYIVKVYVKNKGATRCLNQQTQGSCDDSYAEFSGSAIASGKTLSNTRTLDASEYTSKMGLYLIADNGYYPGDPVDGKFIVVAYLYDDAGNQIGGKSISATYQVSPSLP